MRRDEDRGDIDCLVTGERGGGRKEKGGVRVELWKERERREKGGDGDRKRGNRGETEIGGGEIGRRQR
jgi:hypothetical protein